MDEDNKAMTVNERLYVNGLIKSFYNAVEEKNVQKVREILEKVGMTEPGIIPILQQLGLIIHED